MFFDVFVLKFEMEFSNCPGLGKARADRMGRAIGLCPDRPDSAVHPIHGPTQTDRNEPSGSPVWISLLKMLLEYIVKVNFVSEGASSSLSPPLRGSKSREKVVSSTWITGAKDQSY
jgi:hypothetical protein